MGLRLARLAIGINPFAIRAGDPQILVPGTRYRIVEQRILAQGSRLAHLDQNTAQITVTFIAGLVPRVDFLVDQVPDRVFRAGIVEKLAVFWQRLHHTT